MIANVSRRSFLKGLAGAGGLVLGVQLSPVAVLLDDQEGDEAQPFEPSIWLSIDTDGLVTIVAHRSEMGTGIRTSLPMIVADELEADWDRVRIEQAVGDRRYGSQNTDGSHSIRAFHDGMRRAGAAARQMLETAAAEAWDVDERECTARLHTVVHEPSGRSADFGELVSSARELPVPDAGNLVFKTRDEWRYVGKDVPIIDSVGITTGAARFGLDVVLDGMKFAMIERCPVLGGTLSSLDADDTLAVPGVEQVIELPRYEGSPAFQALGGVAVIAKDTWSALQGRRALQLTWDEGANATYDSTTYAETLLESARRPGAVMRESGDVDAAMAAAAETIEADYELPHLAHAPMEPPCAVAQVTADGCEAWAPTQNPQAAQGMVASALGLSPDQVTIHVTLLGGGFGRKSKPDYVVEAALLAKQIGAPVKLTWTREDDIRHDYYHTVAAIHMQAGLDGDGRPTAWLQRSAFPPIGSTFDARARSGGAGEMGQGFSDIPFAIPNLRCENGPADGHVRIGWLRSVCNIFHAFAVSSFADELAAAAERDPLDYLLELIGEPRRIDLRAQGVPYSNYGGSAEDYPIDTGRLRHVLQLAAGKAGWGRELPEREGLGIAVHRSFLCYVAMAVHVRVDDRGRIAIPRVDVGVDCGLAVHPDRVRAQMEGSAVFGTSLALTGQITASAGRIDQSNFHDYTVARMNAAPREVHVHLVENEEPPGGVGEPGVPPFAPALCNAIFAATGQRIRSLPLSRHDLSKA